MQTDNITLLNLMGISDDNRSILVRNEGTIEKSLIMHKGNVSLLENSFFRRFRMKTVVLGGEQKSEPMEIQIPDLVFNSICDPDTNAKTLQIAAKIVDDMKVPVINDPRRIFATRRDAICELFKNEPGIRIPRTIRIRPYRASDIPIIAKQQNFDFPFIVRPVGTHGGKGMLLIESAEMLTLLEQYPYDGRDYYLIEYVDFKSPDGLYRKYRFFVVGGEVIPRHMIASDSWNIHAADRGSELYEKHDLAKEEEAFVKHPPEKSVAHCKRIYEKLELDYFGIDCAIDENGDLLIFETNVCMRYKTPDPRTDPFNRTPLIERAIADLIERKTGSV